MIALALLAACTGEGGDGSTPDDGTTDTSPTASTTGETGTAPSEWPIAPEIGPPASPDVGLVAVLTLQAERPCTLRITLDSGTHQRVVTPPDLATSHEVPIFGMRADQLYDVLVEATDEQGAVGRATLTWQTDPIPGRFPKLRIDALDKARTEPGWLLFDADTFSGSDFLLILDEDLEVVWYLETEEHWEDVRRSAEGTLVGVVYPEIREVDLLGTELRRYSPLPFATDAIRIDYPFHHDGGPSASGGFVGLVARPVPVPAYPVDYDRTSYAPAEITDHGVATIAADGTLEAVHWLAPVLDTNRIGYDSLNGFQGTMDWSHANGFTETPDGGTIISLRHQDAVVKLDGQGQVVWILSNPDGWTPPLRNKLLSPVGGPFEYPFHQHAPELDAQGHLVLFDNGNYRRTPYDDATVPFQDWSRVVGYRIDETLMTVEQVWEYRDTPLGELFADAVGDADPLPVTGNVLGVFGRVRTIDGEPITDQGLGSKAGVLIEFDPADPDPPAMVLSVYSREEDNADGWAVFRAEKLSGLYPWE
jgi:arylsulfate sulfotransferase